MEKEQLLAPPPGALELGVPSAALQTVSGLCGQALCSRLALGFPS